MDKITLGDKVKDTVTGFTGIAIGKTRWLHGCNRIIVQPEVDKDGKMVEYASFDEPQLEIVEYGAIAIGTTETGGYDISITPKNEFGR